MVHASLRVNGVFGALFLFRLSLAGDRKPTRRQPYLKLLRAEPRYFGPNGNRLIRFRNVQVNWVKEFSLCFEPILMVMARDSSAAFEDFEGTVRD